MSDSPPRVAIITGAGSGIGRALSVRLAGEGYRLMLAGRTHSSLRATASLIADADAVRAHPADVAEPAAADSLVAAAIQAFGRIDVLANVAGCVHMAPLAQTTDAQWRQMLEVNLSGVFYLTRAAWPVFERQRSGLIVNVSSMASRDPFPGLGAYAAAKVAVNMLTTVAAREGESIGIRTLGVAPGAVETPMLRSLFDTDALPVDQTLSPAIVAGFLADRINGSQPFVSGRTYDLQS